MTEDREGFFGDAGVAGVEGGKGTEVDFNKFLNALRRAQKDGFPGGFLSKAETPYLDGEIATREGIEKLGGRLDFHLNRLLEPGRSAAERNFAIALLKHTRKVYEEFPLREGVQIQRVLGDEGYDTCLWWTISPYAFEELLKLLRQRQYPNPEEKAVRILLDWAKTGRASHQVKNGEPQEIYLEGLDPYDRVRREYGDDCTFTLSPNPNGESHRFARSEAQRLVQTVFSKKL